MIKGHVKIDIHNHRSGFTERFEQDNMVTKALDYVIPNWIGANRQPSDYIMPLATRALGGIMLFDAPLTEDVNNIFFPSEAHLIASAGQGTNSVNPRYGSKNGSESMETDTGYQSVWDFNTSQANGNIQSLALSMHMRDGDTGCLPFMGFNNNYELHSVRRLNGDRYFSIQPLTYDVEKQEMYYIGVDDQSSSNVTYDSNRRIYTYHFYSTIYKEYLPTNKWKVEDGGNRADYPEVVAQISLDIESNSETPWWYFRNGYDGYAYFVIVPKNTSGDGQFTYYKMKLSDFSFEISDPVTVTVKSCALYGGYSSAIVNDGKCILKGYNRRWLYVVDLANTVNVRSVDLGEGNWIYSGYNLTNFRNGVVKFTKGTNSDGTRYKYSECLLYPDGWVVENHPYRDDTSYDATGGRQPFNLITDNLLVYGRTRDNYRNYGFMVNNYLGTICNLSSAIVKTAASSMKVTYTLTNVEEGDG